MFFKATLGSRFYHCPHFIDRKLKIKAVKPHAHHPSRARMQTQIGEPMISSIM
jgi:hypothetical protein